MNWKCIPVFFTALSLTTGALAQQRECDLLISLISPSQGQVIQPLAHFDLRINIENLGEDDLIAGDTIYYNTSMMILGTFQPFVLSQGIPAGQSAEVFLDEVANVNENPTDVVVSFCVRATGHPDTAYTGAFKDPITTNNVGCNEVTLISGQTGIAGANKENVFSLYPNPASDQVSLRFNGAQFRPVQIVISDLYGRVRKILPAGPATELLMIPVSDLSPGLYFIQCVNGAQQVTKPFVKR